MFRTLKTTVFTFTLLIGLNLFAKEAKKTDEKPSQPATPHEAFARLEAAKNSRDRDAAAGELAAMGEQAILPVHQGAKKHDNIEVRRACYRLLSEPLHKHQWAGETMARYGLHDKDPQIQYLCAFSLGTHKVYEAHRKLRMVMDDKSADHDARLAATKSLAELGEPDVMGRFFEPLSSDRYMDRYMANIGLKALSGKDLSDFENYDYGEGAFVSGGIEAVRDRNVEGVAEVRARRYLAIAAYAKWLRENRPELYKHFSKTGWLN
jgi:hypothetical protein